MYNNVVISDGPPSPWKSMSSCQMINGLKRLRMRIDSVATELKLAGQLQLQDILSLHSPLIQVAAAPATIIGFEIFFFFGPVHVPMALLSGIVCWCFFFFWYKKQRNYWNRSHLRSVITLFQPCQTCIWFGHLKKWIKLWFIDIFPYIYRYWAILLGICDLPFRNFIIPSTCGTSNWTDFDHDDHLIAFCQWFFSSWPRLVASPGNFFHVGQASRHPQNGGFLGILLQNI